MFPYLIHVTLTLFMFIQLNALICSRVDSPVSLFGLHSIPQLLHTLFVLETYYNGWMAKSVNNHGLCALGILVVRMAC